MTSLQRVLPNRPRRRDPRRSGMNSLITVRAAGLRPAYARPDRLDEMRAPAGQALRVRARTPANFVKNPRYGSILLSIPAAYQG
jgi:hypothetical protein